MPLSPPAQPISDSNSQIQPIHGTSILSSFDNLLGSEHKRSYIAQERQSLTQGDNCSQVMIATVTSSSQHPPVIKDATHRSSQSVPISPSSPTFRHSASSSISILPLTPETSPRYRPKYGKRLSDNLHKVTSPLIPKDENEPPRSSGAPAKKQSVTFPLRISEEREGPVVEKDSFTTLPSTFPLVSPPASPPLSKRKLRPSLEGVFDTPSPKPRTSGVLTPSTEQPSKFIRDRDRKLPRGENPFIFGKQSSRRTTRSDPESINLDAVATLQTPALNVTQPTPRASPSKSQGTFLSDPTPFLSSPSGKLKPPSDHGHGHTKTVTYEDEVIGGSSLLRSKSRESTEQDDKLGTLSSVGSRNVSNVRPSSPPPSAFGPARRNSKSKANYTERISPVNAPEGGGSSAGNTTPERPRTTTPRPTSRVGSTRAKSIQYDASSSRTSIPISAFVNPRPPSVGGRTYDFIRRDEGLYMRDPYREPRQVGWKVHPRGKQIEQVVDQEAGAVQPDQLRSPVAGLLFYPGFLFPPFWWIASFLKETRFDPQIAADGRWTPWRVQLSRDQDLNAITWRNRCRFMALVSLVTYLPLIVLLAVFIPK